MTLGDGGRYAVEAVNLTKVFAERRGRRTVALDGLSLRVPRGEFFGLVGPNGAGKTTFIKILCTLVLPTSGSASVNGFDVVKEPLKVRESIGWLHGETGGRALYWRLSARDNLAFYAYMHNVPPRVAKERIEALLDFFGLKEKADLPVKGFSTGMKFRLMLARCLLPNPPILLLDEPTAGLDAPTAAEIRELLKELNAEMGKTVIFASHNLYEVERLCRRVAVIDGGRVVAEGSPAELSQIVSAARSVEVRFRGCDLSAAVKAVELLDVDCRVLEARDDGEHVTVRFEPSRDESGALVPAVASRLERTGLHVVSVGEVRPSFEEVFLQISRKAKRG